MHINIWHLKNWYPLFQQILHKSPRQIISISWIFLIDIKLFCEAMFASVDHLRVCAFHSRKVFCVDSNLSSTKQQIPI